MRWPAALVRLLQDPVGRSEMAQRTRAVARRFRWSGPSSRCARWSGSRGAGNGRAPTCRRRAGPPRSCAHSSRTPRTSRARSSAVRAPRSRRTGRRCSGASRRAERILREHPYLVRAVHRVRKAGQLGPRGTAGYVRGSAEREVGAPARQVTATAGRPPGARAWSSPGSRSRSSMAGPAIRAWEMARVLAGQADVMLATLSPVCQRAHPDFRTTSATDAQLRAARAVVRRRGVPGVAAASTTRGCGTRRSVLVADVYDPFHLEVLEQLRDGDEGGARPSGRAQPAGPQRPAAAGRLGALRLATSSATSGSGTLPHWAGSTRSPTTPTAIAAVAASRWRRSASRRAAGRERHRCLKGVVPGIGPDDKVVLWGGGVYNWFDPLTLMRAVDRLAQRTPDVRLFFLGMRHPNPEVAEMRSRSRDPCARRRARPDRHRTCSSTRTGSPYDRPAELPARGRPRRQHAPRPRRDRVLVPHPRPRLPLGRAAGGGHPRRQPGGAGRARGPRPHRPRRGRRGPGAGPRADALRRAGPGRRPGRDRPGGHRPGVAVGAGGR